ncbi:MAG: cation-translocating P-type ATPase [Desulfobacterales bacterium]|nr:cation-translocating P-type ATPase [Pseudomonadota bacterium]MCG2770645.1 cation-translocating P-type ATPase [Desulfobacterales bacterium]
MTEVAEKLPFHTMAPEQVLEALGTGPAGLDRDAAQALLSRYGPNELAAGKKISAWSILLRQFANLLIVILLAATVISFFLGESLDAYVILAIVLACVGLGFFQEYRAEQAAAALQKLAAPVATVVRDGKERSIPAREVVPGDVLVLHTGDRVAADARLLEEINLKADEALLTGESTASGKKLAPVADPDLAVADRKCMVFGGTVITYGRGRGVVTATGMDTEFGKIARMLADVTEDKTPLEARMASIGRVLSVICLSVALGASLLGVLRGHSWLEMLIWGISLAVAAVPESLPAVVTGALAIGTTRMARKNAIVKRLPAVETMGCTTVICTDKTGTLTKNEMTVRRLFLDGEMVDVSGTGYEPSGSFGIGDAVVSLGDHPVLACMARIALLCNDAALEENDGNWTVRGDPTEGALLVLGRKAGLDPEALSREFPRVAEIPFSSEAKRMSTFHKEPDGVLMYVKGASERLLPRASMMLTAGGERSMSAEDRDAVQKQAAAMAHEALRVLGLAYRRLPAVPDLESDAADPELVWVGLVGMIDPPRPEARQAVDQCRQAGIRVIMITGDHPVTASAVAREVGLVSPGQESHAVITGPELNQLSDPELKEALREVRVFARVAPEHKLRLVDILKEQGEVVAMTGDGVNDAPALKRADIGVAMGITGTEVTKETAAMILADDNFATLVAAVEEGRAIFDNIKKYLVFLLSCNLTEILVLTGAFFLGMPLPLIALQILWVNLTTDGLPALALGVDPKAPDIMSRPPRPPAEGVFSPTVTALLVTIALYLTAILIPMFGYYYYWNPWGLSDPEMVLTEAQTMVFITLVLVQLVNAFNCRSDYLSLFKVGVFGNRFLILAVLVSLGMMVMVIEWDPLSHLFHTTPLRWQDWLVAAGLSLTLVPVVELTKWIVRRRGRSRRQTAAAA